MNSIAVIAESMRTPMTRGKIHLALGLFGTEESERYERYVWAFRAGYFAIKVTDQESYESLAVLSTMMQFHGSHN